MELKKNTVQFSGLSVLFIKKIVNETTHMQQKRHTQLNVYTAQQPVNLNKAWRCMKWHKIRNKQTLEI